MTSLEPLSGYVITIYLLFLSVFRMRNSFQYHYILFLWKDILWLINLCVRSMSVFYSLAYLFLRLSIFVLFQYIVVICPHLRFMRTYSLSKWNLILYIQNLFLTILCIERLMGYQWALLRDRSCLIFCEVSWKDGNLFSLCWRCILSV